MNKLLGLFVSLAAGLALSAAAADSTRVYVNFNPGAFGAGKELVQNAKGQIHYTFENLNAVAATLPSEAIAALERNPAISFIEEDPPRFPSATLEAPYGINMVQATGVWDANGDNAIDNAAFTGAGIKVGIIDSGVYRAHADFTGVSVSGYNGNLAWDQDGFGHGTHVSGTIAAALNGQGVVGVSPGKVSLYMVRVFDDAGNWTYSSTLLEAAQRCQSAGCQIISMSLGGGSPSQTEQAGLDAIYNNGNGVLLIAAAGNAGNTTVSYPAGYASVVSVAAIDSTRTVASFSQKNSDVELCAPGVGVLSTVPFTTAALTVGNLSYPAETIEYAAYDSKTAPLINGGYAGATDASWAGKVVLVQRGNNISFYDKVMNVQKSGGVAAVIYNNAPGGFSGTLGAGKSSTIPAISVSKETGDYLIGNSIGASATVNTYAAKQGNGYAYYDGTSMATPHVSGVAALVWSSKPTAKAGDIRSVLQLSARDLGTTGRDNSYGYGLVQAQDAITKLATYTGGGGDTTAPKILSGPTAKVVNSKQGTFSISWTTDEASTTVVTLGGTSYPNTSLVTSHSMTFRGTKGATFSYSVSSADAAGNTVTSPTTTFTNK